MSEPYLIFDAEMAQRGEMLLWWRPNRSGYTVRLDAAGRYSADEIRSKPDYYSNFETTIAVPESIALSYAVRVVPAGGTMLERMRKHATISKPSDEVCNCGSELDGSHDHTTCGPPIPRHLPLKMPENRAELIDRATSANDPFLG